jgi:hypothetical protein
VRSVVRALRTPYRNEEDPLPMIKINNIKEPLLAAALT